MIDANEQVTVCEWILNYYGNGNGEEDKEPSA